MHEGWWQNALLSELWRLPENLHDESNPRQCSIRNLLIMCTIFIYPCLGCLRTVSTPVPRLFTAALKADTSVCMLSWRSLERLHLTTIRVSYFTATFVQLVEPSLARNLDVILKTLSAQTRFVAHLDHLAVGEPLKFLTCGAVHGYPPRIPSCST